MSGDRRTHRSTGGEALAETRFIPRRYEPNYAYPLLMCFHGRGGDENQLVRSIPSMSWRNYVGIGLRGPEIATRDGEPVGYGWGAEFARPHSSRRRHEAAESPATILGRALGGEAPDGFDRVEDGVFGAIRQARTSLHVHSERIFLVGRGEGAAVAFRMGLTYPERFAGVVAINGWIPGGFRPLGRLKACRGLRVLVVHGQWNTRSPIRRVRRDVETLRAGGLRVAYQAYPSGNSLTDAMLSDVDTWLINQCVSGA